MVTIYIQKQAVNHVVSVIYIKDRPTNQPAANLQEQMKMITFIVFMLNAIIFVLSRKSISYEVLYNNKYVDDYFMLFPTRSEIECTTRCYQEMTCTYFSLYRKEQYACSSQQRFISQNKNTKRKRIGIYLDVLTKV